MAWDDDLFWLKNQQRVSLAMHEMDGLRDYDA